MHHTRFWQVYPLFIKLQKSNAGAGLVAYLSALAIPVPYITTANLLAYKKRKITMKFTFLSVANLPASRQTKNNNSCFTFRSNVSS